MKVEFISDRWFPSEPAKCGQAKAESRGDTSGVGGSLLALVWKVVCNMRAKLIRALFLGAVCLCCLPSAECWGQQPYFQRTVTWHRGPFGFWRRVVTITYNPPAVPAPPIPAPTLPPAAGGY